MKSSPPQPGKDDAQDRALRQRGRQHQVLRRPCPLADIGGTGAPILLVSATSCLPRHSKRVDELAPTTKIVGGGPNTVSETVRSRLGATRWSGAPATTPPSRSPTGRSPKLAQPLQRRYRRQAPRCPYRRKPRGRQSAACCCSPTAPPHPGHEELAHRPQEEVGGSNPSSPTSRPVLCFSRPRATRPR
jgi:hypothetical protein